MSRAHLPDHLRFLQDPRPLRAPRAVLRAERDLSALEDDEEAQQLARELASATWSRARASRLPF